MKSIIFLLCIIISQTVNFDKLKKDALPIFEGEIYYEYYSGSTMTEEIEGNHTIFSVVDHPILFKEIRRYQIKDEVIIQSSFLHDQDEVYHISSVQKKGLRKVLKTKPPKLEDSGEIQELFKEFNMLALKNRKAAPTLRKKREILGVKCRLYTEEKYSEFQDKHYITEYWINEDMKYQQHQYAGTFSQVLLEEGLIMEKIGFEKSSKDTISRSRIIDLNLKSQAHNPFKA